MVTLTAMTLLLVTGRAEAEKLGGEGEPKGDEFLRQKKPKVAKDYYVVPTGQSHQCSIVAGEWEKKPAGALGGAPYASADYAKAALKTFPECKGGEPDEETDKKHRKKMKRGGAAYSNHPHDVDGSISERALAIRTRRPCGSSWRNRHFNIFPSTSCS